MEGKFWEVKFMYFMTFALKIKLQKNLAISFIIETIWGKGKNVQ